MAFCPGLPGWAGTVSGSAIRWAICKSAPRSRHITTPAPHRSFFYRPDALPAALPTVSKHWRQILILIVNEFNIISLAADICKQQIPLVTYSIMMNVPWRRFNQSVKQLKVGHTSNLSVIQYYKMAYNRHIKHCGQNEPIILHYSAHATAITVSTMFHYERKFHEQLQ